MASRELAGPYQVVGMLLPVCGRRDEPERKLLLPPKLQPDFPVLGDAVSVLCVV